MCLKGLVLSDRGYNPLRWDCESQGCFNIKCRPKIEVFSQCFPGKINFGDVDGIVEMNSKALMLEWKPGKGLLTTGQRIMYRNLTSVAPITVLCVVGSAETMVCESYSYYHKGKFHDSELASLEKVMEFMSQWARWAVKK